MRIYLKLGQAFSQLREFARAMPCYEQALAFAEELDNRHGILEARWSMAYTATSRGDLITAAQTAEAILAHERVGGDPLLIASALELLAWIALSGDDLETAASRLEEAWRSARTVPHWAEAIRTNLLMDEAILAYRRGDEARAVELILEGLPRARTLNSSADLLFALLLFAGIAARHDRAAEAARGFGALRAALEEGEHSFHLEPAVRPWHEADMARAREALGAAAFDDAWTAGSQISLDEALAAAEELVRELFGLLAETTVGTVTGGGEDRPSSAR
jgi:hypothetical protein